MQQETIDWTASLRQATQEFVFANLLLELEKSIPAFSAREFRARLLLSTEQQPDCTPRDVVRTVRNIRRQAIWDMVPSSTHDLSSQQSGEM